MDATIALPGRPGESVDWLDILRGEGAEAVRAGILAATPFVPTPSEQNGAEREERRRPLIRVMGGDLAPAVQEALAALAGERDPLAAVYVRGNLLVLPTRLRNRLTADGIRRPVDALVLRVVDADWTCLRLAQLADFYVLTKEKVRPVDPPLRLCRSVLAATPWPQLPSLTGIIEAPTVRPDGSLLTRPGYDAKTGLLFDPGQTNFPPIPNEPTRSQAEMALRTLSQPFEDFPFVDDAARSVALAAVITMLVRRTLRAAPLFAFDAPKMASGKTLAATVCSYIATGRVPYLMPQVADPADDRKRLLSALIEGPAAIVIDNIELPLRSDALCIALTEPTFTDRLLGASKTATVATNCCFFATGNNLVIADDLSARALVSRIDPNVERPEEREFALDLHSWVPENRGKLVAAALTIVRAYLAAGAPKPRVPNFARFEDWQQLCRFPLIWLDVADPCETRRRIEQADPVSKSLRALLAAWHGQFGEHRLTVKAAIAGAFPDLRAAMEDVAGEKGDINAWRLGQFLSRHERRIEGGLCFEKGGERGGVACWRARNGGSGGFRGFPPSPSREKASANGDKDYQIDRLGTNPPNPPNPPSSDRVEVEL